MKLHAHPLSSYSRKVLIGADLRGDALDVRVPNVFEGELTSAAFRALNPFGKMPVLETDEGPVFESTSILEYLEERGPRVLLPAGEERRARHFDRLGDLYLLDPLGAYFWDKSDEKRAKVEGTTKAAWSLWEKALADGRRFVCGDTITLGDLSAAIATDLATTEDVPLPDAIRRYQHRLDENPAVRRAREAAAPFVESTKPRRGGRSEVL
jgi:glutathione S-transferase